MKTEWMLNTHGDPLGILRNFIHTIWVQSGWDQMMVSVNGDGARTKPILLNSPKQLEKINPFTPLMPINAAKYVPKILEKTNGFRLGILLRPCEMRAIIEMIKRAAFDTERLESICVDCLGTFPSDEYDWRAERKGSSKELSRETIQFARQGGIVPYRYRSACQMCISPEASGADLNIGVLGIPVRQYLIIHARDESTAQRFNLQEIVKDPADPSLLNQHKHMVAKLSERNARTRERVTQSLLDFLPQDVDGLADHLKDCEPCQACLDNCPICSIDFPQREESGKYKRQSLMRWLISCSGCGICEQSCPNHLPLSIILGHIHDQLAEKYNYTAGRSIEEPIPIL